MATETNMARQRKPIRKVHHRAARQLKSAGRDRRLARYEEREIIAEVTR
jgi:hypothetical protein